jgi:spore maturation protein SpmA
MTLWLGLMRLADKAGLVNRLGLALKPIMKWLFPEVPADHPAMGAIILNVAANILGLNNAATPLGLRAMNELESLNRRPGVATNAMCMLLAINTSSITLIPVTVIGLLTLAHGKNPTAVIGTALAASVVAHIAAIGACKLLERSRFFKLAPISKEKPAGSHDKAEDERAKSGAEIARETAKRDEALPWVPYAGYMLAAMCGLFLAMLLVTAFPELTGPVGTDTVWRSFGTRMQNAWNFLATEPGTGLKVFGLRLINGLSILSIPWLILFFPFYAMLRRIPVYEEFVEGAKESVPVIIRILPYLVGMLVATGMFSAAGGMDLITWLARPVTSLFGFPPELLPLAIIRPFSGAASLPLLQNVIDRFGPDSLLAMTAGTMYGCSETTFYVIAVYFGSVGIRKTRHAIPAGIVADVVGPVASVVICRAVFG